ncbi:hypothetical protein BDF19DRAFT_127412 [Syncephalis fuscata]|nr:hypothetical protein BDF19DRAFT_127412 [Syncephalis fuscata]
MPLTNQPMTVTLSVSHRSMDIIVDANHDESTTSEPMPAVTDPSFTAQSATMSFLSELSTIDWANHGWDAQENFQQLLQGCSNTNQISEQMLLMTGDAFFSPLFEGDFSHLQANLPIFHHGALLDSHVNPSLTLQTYPPSPSSSGAETEDVSRAQSTASPSPHLLSTSIIPDHPASNNSNIDHTTNNSNNNSNNNNNHKQYNLKSNSNSVDDDTLMAQHSINTSTVTKKSNKGRRKRDWDESNTAALSNIDTPKTKRPTKTNISSPVLNMN